MRRALRPGRAELLGLLACLVESCGGPPLRPTPTRQPPPSADTTAVTDAVPRVETRSTHGNPPFYEVDGRRYTVLASADGFVERGVASWYGPDFHGHSTSSGEAYDMYAMTAAHRTLPLPCYARITNLSNGRSVVVRINDRGPFVANRIVDLSYTAAQRLDVVRAGTAFVELRVVGPETMIETNSAPPEAPPVPETPLQAPAGQSLYIQVGAYGDPANAARVVARLQAAGVPRVFTIDGTAGGRVLERVRVGPLASVEDYDQLAERLARIGFQDARLATD